MSVTAICREQQEWAANRGIAFDARGYVPNLDLNLMRPLSPATLAAFANGDGGELLERGDKPAKMRALHSSSALAANIFDFWTDCADATPLMKALALPSCPTAAYSNPNCPQESTVTPTWMCACHWRTASWPAWRASSRNGCAASNAVGEAFRPPYLAKGRRRWEEVGLPRAQARGSPARGPGGVPAHGARSYLSMPLRLLGSMETVGCCGMCTSIGRDHTESVIGTKSGGSKSWLAMN